MKTYNDQIIEVNEAFLNSYGYEKDEIFFLNLFANNY